MTDTIRIETATTAQERRDVFRLRYRVLVEETSYQIPGIDVDTGIEQASDEYSDMVLIYDADVPVATLTCSLWEKGPLPDGVEEHFALAQLVARFSCASIGVLHKGAILPSHRGGTLLARMLQYVFFNVIQSHHRFILIDCSPYLVTYYEGYGFRRIGTPFCYDDTGILAVPMCLVMNDQLDLEQRRARLLPLIQAQGIPDDPVVRDFLAPHDASSPGELSESALTTVIEPVPGRIEPLSAALFEGMSRPIVTRLLDDCHRIVFKRKQVLIQVGDSNPDVYLILEGYMEILVERDGQRLALITRGPGDLLGEIGFLLDTGRSASVSALTDGEVIHIPASTIAQHTKENPESTLILYRNLARILAEKLRSAGRRVLSSPPL